MKKIFELSATTNDSLVGEINQLDESFEKARCSVQTKSIGILNEYLAAKIEIANDTKRLMRRGDSSELFAHELDALKQHFDRITDSVWFNLIEIETLLHERINETRNVFAANIHRLIGSFLQTVRPIFEEIKIAGQEYYRLVGEKYDRNEFHDDVVAEAIKIDRNAHWETSQKIQDDFFDCVNDWMVAMLATYNA